MNKHIKKVIFFFLLVASFVLINSKIAKAGPSEDCWLLCPGGCYLACDFGPCSHGTNWLKCNGYTFYCNC